MIEFALNYSRPAAALVREGRIEVDRFKCPDWPGIIEEARAVRPVYVHFPIGAGTPESAGVDLGRVEEMAAAASTRFIDLHLAPQVKDFPGMSDAQVEARLIEDVSKVVEHFGAERVMVEMVPFGNPEEGFVQAATEPEMIGHIVEQTGCGLLLDLSHARITARVLNQDEREFLDRMPVNKLRELHVTGLGWLGPILKDHRPMTDDDWDMFRWAIQRIRTGAWATPWCIACEYGGVGELFQSMTDPAVLQRDIPKMRQMVRSFPESL